MKEVVKLFSWQMVCAILTTILIHDVSGQQLDKLFKSLGFTQKKADGQVRWAVLNTVITLRRHEKARSVLANAMSQGRSVGYCIDIIEKTMGDDI